MLMLRVYLIECSVVVVVGTDPCSLMVALLVERGG